MKGFGWDSLETGQSLDPAPPDRMTGISMLSLTDWPDSALFGMIRDQNFFIIES